MISAQLQSTILKTKKKLSRIYLEILCITMSFLFCAWVFLYAAQSVTKSWKYSQVMVAIPSVLMNKENFSLQQKKIDKKQIIDNDTATLTLTPKGLYLSTLDKAGNIPKSNSYSAFVPNQKGRPLIHTMIQHIKKIRFNNEVLIFIPEKDVPITVIIRIIHFIKQKKLFKQVIMSSGVT